MITKITRLIRFLSTTILLAPSLLYAQHNIWKCLGPENYNVQLIEIAPSDPNIIYVSNRYNIYRTNDAGKSWTRLSEISDRHSHILGGMVVDPINPEILYVSNTHGSG